MNNKPTVVILSPRLPVPPSLGGAIETIIYKTAPLLSEDYSVKVYSIGQSKDAGSVEHRENDVCYYQLNMSALKQNMYKYVNRFAKRGYFDLHDRDFICSVIKHQKGTPEIIHIHNQFYYIPRIRKAFPEAKIILHMHNDLLFTHRYLYKEYVRCLQKADMVVCVSGHVSNRILSYFPALGNKIIVIYNGVEVGHFKKIAYSDKINEWVKKLNLDRPSEAVLFVGRICEDKGVEYLVKAFIDLKKLRNKMKLILVGSSWFSGGGTTSYTKRLNRISSAMRKDIIFTGYVDYKELPYLYNIASICVVPSIFKDPFPLVPLEAMASGTPVLASKIGGIQELIVDGQTGILVPPGDIEALKNQLSLLLTDKELSENISKRAMNLIHNKFSWETMANNIKKAYKMLLIN